MIPIESFQAALKCRHQLPESNQSKHEQEITRTYFIILKNVSVFFLHRFTEPDILRKHESGDTMVNQWLEKVFQSNNTLYTCSQSKSVAVFISRVIYSNVWIWSFSSGNDILSSFSLIIHLITRVELLDKIPSPLQIFDFIVTTLEKLQQKHVWH